MHSIQFTRTIFAGYLFVYSTRVSPSSLPQAPVSLPLYLVVMSYDEKYIDAEKGSAGEPQLAVAEETLRMFLHV